MTRAKPSLQEVGCPLIWRENPKPEREKESQSTFLPNEEGGPGKCVPRFDLKAARCTRRRQPVLSRQCDSGDLRKGRKHKKKILNYG
jgi:hypothetical protein